jgi:hypothetical protein
VNEVAIVGIMEDVTVESVKVGSTVYVQKNPNDPQSAVSGPLLYKYVSYSNDERLYYNLWIGYPNVTVVEDIADKVAIESDMVVNEEIVRKTYSMYDMELLANFGIELAIEVELRDLHLDDMLVVKLGTLSYYGRIQAIIQNASHATIRLVEPKTGDIRTIELLYDITRYTFLRQVNTNY